MISFFVLDGVLDCILVVVALVVVVVVVAVVAMSNSTVKLRKAIISQGAVNARGPNFTSQGRPPPCPLLPLNTNMSHHILYGQV